MSRPGQPKAGGGSQAPQLAQSTGQLKLGAALSYAGTIFSVLAGLIYTPWMVGQIGRGDFGLYTLSISLISMFVMDFGLSEAVSRALAKYRAEDRVDEAREFLGIAYKLYLLLDILIFVVLVLVFWFIESIYTKLTAEELVRFKTIFLISGMFTVAVFPFTALSGILVAYERFAFQKALELVQKVVLVLLMAGALMLGYKLYALVIINAFVGILQTIIKLIYIRRSRIISADISSRNLRMVRGIFKYTAWTTVILVAQRLILNITPTVLGIVSGSTEIAVFSIGMTVEGYTWTFAGALAGLFLPRVTKLMNCSGAESLEGIESLMLRVGRIQLIVVGAIVAIFAATGTEFMTLWMGDVFRQSYWVALLLIAPCLITLTQEIAHTMLVAANEIRYRALATIAAAGTSILLSFPLAWLWGAPGAAAAVFLGNVVGFVVIMNLVYAMVLRLNMRKFFIECHLKLLAPILCTFGLGLLIQRAFDARNLMQFAIKVMVLGCAYLLMMWRFALVEAEKAMFLAPWRMLQMKVGHKKRR